MTSTLSDATDQPIEGSKNPFFTKDTATDDTRMRRNATGFENSFTNLTLKTR